MIGLSIFENDQTLGDVNTAGVRLFEFWWDNVRPVWSNETLHTQHAVFNRLFSQVFPRLVYTNPFTSYNESGLGISSRLYGLAETYSSDAQLRQMIPALAQDADIMGDLGDLTISGKSFDQLQSGQSLLDPGYSVNPLVTTDGSKLAVNSFLGDLKWPALIAGGVLIFILIDR